MRVIGLLVLGLLIGVFATAAAMNALRAKTAFPHGVMAVTGYHMGQLRDAATAAPCRAEVARPHVDALAMLAADIVPAFLPDGQQDPTFSQYAEQHHATLSRVLEQWPPADCPALTQALGEIGDGCKACHRDYK